MESPFHLYTCIVWYCIVFFQASSFQSDTNIPSFELVPSMIPAIICITFTKGCLMRSRNLGCWCGKYIAAVPNAKTIHLSQIHPKKNALLSVNKTIFPFFKQLKNQDHRLPLTLYTKKRCFFTLNETKAHDGIRIQYLWKSCLFLTHGSQRFVVQLHVCELNYKLRDLAVAAEKNSNMDLQKSTCTLPENKDTQNDALEKQSSASKYGHCEYLCLILKHTIPEIYNKSLWKWMVGIQY